MAHNLGIDKTFVASMLFCFLLIYVQVTSANHKDHSFNQKLEVQKLLKKLNKPAVKSIKVHTLIFFTVYKFIFICLTVIWGKTNRFYGLSQFWILSLFWWITAHIVWSINSIFLLINSKFRTLDGLGLGSSRDPQHTLELKECSVKYL